MPQLFYGFPVCKPANPQWTRGGVIPKLALFRGTRINRIIQKMSILISIIHYMGMGMGGDRKRATEKLAT